MIDSTCKECLQKKFIVNKKYELCDDCNYKRLHKGKSKQEIYSERQSTKPKKIFVAKVSKKPIKQVSSKQKEENSRMSIVKKEIELKAIQDGNYFCWGCGISHPGLDKSHIISVKYKKTALDKENINLFCRKCHEKWESRDVLQIINLDSFKKDLKYLSVHSLSDFGSLMTSIEYCLAEGYFQSESEELKAQEILHHFNWTSL